MTGVKLREEITSLVHRCILSSPAVMFSYTCQLQFSASVERKSALDVNWCSITTVQATHCWMS